MTNRPDQQLRNSTVTQLHQSITTQHSPLTTSNFTTTVRRCWARGGLPLSFLQCDRPLDYAAISSSHTRPARRSCTRLAYRTFPQSDQVVRYLADREQDPGRAKPPSHPLQAHTLAAIPIQRRARVAAALCYICSSPTARRSCGTSCTVALASAPRPSVGRERPSFADWEFLLSSQTQSISVKFNMSSQ